MKNVADMKAEAAMNNRRHKDEVSELSDKLDQLLERLSAQ
jgi:hypothetical protein